MSISPLRSSNVSGFSSTNAVSPRAIELTSPGPAQKRCGTQGPRGMHQQDGFDAGPRREAQMEKMLQGVVSTLLQTVQALTQALQAQAGGANPGAAPGAVSGAAPGAAPGAEAGAAPGAEGPSSPVDLNPSSEASPSPSGDAKLAGNVPPALGQYKDAIESAAAKAGVPAAMIAGQIWQESRGDLSAATTNGGNGLTDTGLMQVNPNTFKELQAKHPELQGKNLSDPATNILAGAFYMKDMKDQFGSWDLALRAYNSGPNGVDKSNPNAIPAGTGDATYVQKVKSFWDTLSTGKGSLPA